jgi:hypothetical protein
LSKPRPSDFWLVNAAAKIKRPRDTTEGLCMEGQTHVRRRFTCRRSLSLTMEQLSNVCVATCEITAREFAEFLALFSSPSCVMRQFLLCQYG